MPIKLILLRLVTLVALAGSTASLADRLLPSPAFCAFGGCAQVSESSYSQIAGIPLGAFGLVGFATVYLFTFATSKTGWIILGALVSIAGLGGLALLLIQKLILHQFCSLCLIVDISAIILPTLYFSPLPEGKLDEGALQRWLWGGLGLVVLIAPWGWGWLNPIIIPPQQIPVPEQAKRRWESGKINIVLVTDFECPSCQKTYPALKQLLQEKKEEAHLTIIPCPLKRQTDTWHASRAFLAAQAQGKGREMADALFQAQSFDAADCAQKAAQLGVSMEQYRADVKAADDRIREIRKWVGATGAKGLPLLWIQEQSLTGAQDLSAIRQAWESALKDAPSSSR